MKKLDRNLKEWVSLGLLSDEQAKSISEHEATKPESSWLLSSLVILGVLIVGIGIISLIAANWNQIPDAIKLTANFILLIALATATFKSFESNKPILFEALLLSFVIHCLASIGLISQIFHTSGKLYQALMLWSLMTFALTLAARNVLVPFVWTGTFLVSLAFYALDSKNLGAIYFKNYLALLTGLTLLSSFLGVLSRYFALDHSSTRAYRMWSLLAGLTTLIVAELHQDSLGQNDKTFWAFGPAYFLAILMVLIIGINQQYKKIQKFILILSLLFFIISTHLSSFSVKSSLLYALSSLVLLSLIAAFLASLKERRLFQLILSLIAMRFLFLYFQALGGLAATGIGLIGSGILVITLAFLWNKYKLILAQWMERLVE